MATAKERMRKSRARRRGEAIEKERGGPKLGYRQSEEHIAKRMKQPIPVVERKRPVVERRAPERERTFVDMKASPEIEEPKEVKVEATEPADPHDWREKRLGSRVVWQCRG